MSEVPSEALEAAKEIVAETPDEGRLRAVANLCAYSGYDEDGSVAKFRAFIVARALIEAAAEIERLKQAGR